MLVGNMQNLTDVVMIYPAHLLVLLTLLKVLAGVLSLLR